MSNENADFTDHSIIAVSHKNLPVEDSPMKQKIERKLTYADNPFLDPRLQQGLSP